MLGIPTPRYLHVPVALSATGEKLSKQTGARAIDAHQRAAVMGAALAFLGQRPTADLDEAIAAWDPARIPRRFSAPADG